MGYSTEFIGKFSFNKKPSTELIEYINRFSKTRHVKRDVEAMKMKFPDWDNRCWKGNMGSYGEFFVIDDNETDNSKLKIHDREGYLKDNCLTDDIQQPASQPGIWCHWIINESSELVWNGSEKFYNYAEWLEYLIINFFKPEGLLLFGKCFYCGEKIDDWGYLCVEDNKVLKIPYDIHVDSSNNMLNIRMPDMIQDELEIELGLRYGVSLEYAIRKFILWCLDNPENFAEWIKM